MGLLLLALLVLLVERAGSFSLPANLPSTFYFSCRHTFEDTLAEELRRCGSRPGAATVIAPGLLRVAEFPADAWHGDWDLTYALQALPHAHAVSAPGASIAQLATEAIDAVGLSQGGPRVDALRSAPKGSLAIHALVPDQFRGTPLEKAKMHRRCSTIVERISKTLKVAFPAARALKGAEAPPAGRDRWVMQVLLLENDEAAVSLAQCSGWEVGGTWPCWHLAAGLADVDIDKVTEPMPSSAYRKLEEAFACMQISPVPSDTCVDLGACPGGWTKALRRYGASVTAVDRSPLISELMRDAQVTFVQGDAFAFNPLDTERGGGGQRVDWMIFSQRMVTTMKFKGAPDWEQLARARTVAEAAGYACRSKHFFNNKNEVTLMLSKIS